MSLVLDEDEGMRSFREEKEKEGVVGEEGQR